MTDPLHLVKQEPKHSHTPPSHTPPTHTTKDTNPNSNSNHTISSLVPPPLPTHTNPFGPSYGHHQPFSPMPQYTYPPMPFQSHTPLTYATDTRTHPMFYPPLFHTYQPPLPPSHYNHTSDNTHTSNDTPQPSQSPKPTAQSPKSDTHKSQQTAEKGKNYSFTPGMQPGAYYLIPLNTPTVDHSHIHMPLINGNESKNGNGDTHKSVKSNEVLSDTSSMSSESSSDEDSDESEGVVDMNKMNTNTHKPIATMPQLPHFPISANSFPPPTLPPQFPYTEMSHNNGHSFSVAAIDDKKSVITQIQSISFPPLPTNNSMTQTAMDLNSNFASASAEMDTIQTGAGDSSDQDMDVALGTVNASYQMPIMPQIPTHTNNGYYHNITPFTVDEDTKNTKPKPQRRKSKTIKKSPKINTKKTKTQTRLKKKKKVSDKLSSLSPSNYTDISVHVPALNKIGFSKPLRIQERQSLTDIPDLSDHDTQTNTNTHDSDRRKRKRKAPHIPIPPPVTVNPEPKHIICEGQMEVAYSQQYPQVGFPFIYNSEAEKGKKFTCKFMDSRVNVHSDGLPQFCDRQFGQKCHWMRHCLEKHVPTEMSQRYQCRYCNMKYAQNSSLKEHVAICHSNKPPAFKCPYCAGEITFTRWTSVLRHCRNQHSGEEMPKKSSTRTSTKRTCKVQNGSKRKRRGVKVNGNGRKRMRRDHSAESSVIERGMPSVNMNISMSGMLSGNSYSGAAVVPANVSVGILPPRNGNSNNGNSNNGIR